MANLNDKTEFIAGRNPLQESLRPAFTKPEADSAVIWLENGIVNAEKSTGDSVVSSAVDANGNILNLEYASDAPYENAVVIDGGNSVLLSPKINLSGYGCSDFTCKGAAVLAENGAKVDIRNADIETHGCTRAATIATTGSRLKVFNSKLSTTGGPLPPDYKPVIGPGMMEPPAPLGLGGNCRTHLSMDNSETYFYDCDISADGWAALSTDASGGYVYMEANDSSIDMKGNGYCIYADNGCHVRLNRCDLHSGNVFGIQDGNSSVRFSEVAGNCEGYGFLLHGGMHDLKDIGTIVLEDCDLESIGPMFRCKSTNVDLYLVGGNLVAEDGVFLESILTDDEFYYKTRSHSDNEYGIQVTMEDMEVNGAFLCNDPERPTKLHLADAQLYGEVTGYPELTLTGTSTWYAPKDSFVVLSSSDGLDAPKGVTIHAKAQEGSSLEATYLPSGGQLVVE